MTLHRRACSRCPPGPASGHFHQQESPPCPAHAQYQSRRPQFRVPPIPELATTYTTAASNQQLQLLLYRRRRQPRRLGPDDRRPRPRYGHRASWSPTSATRSTLRLHRRRADAAQLERQFRPCRRDRRCRTRQVETAEYTHLRDRHSRQLHDSVRSADQEQSTGVIRPGTQRRHMAWRSTGSPFTSQLDRRLRRPCARRTPAV